MADANNLNTGAASGSLPSLFTFRCYERSFFLIVSFQPHQHLLPHSFILSLFFILSPPLHSNLSYSLLLTLLSSSPFVSAFLFPFPKCLSFFFHSSWFFFTLMPPSLPQCLSPSLSEMGMNGERRGGEGETRTRCLVCGNFIVIGDSHRETRLRCLTSSQFG